MIYDKNDPGDNVKRLMPIVALQKNKARGSFPFLPLSLVADLYGGHGQCNYHAAIQPSSVYRAPYVQAARCLIRQSPVVSDGHKKDGILGFSPCRNSVLGLVLVPSNPTLNAVKLVALYAA